MPTLSAPLKRQDIADNPLGGGGGGGLTMMDNDEDFDRMLRESRKRRDLTTCCTFATATRILVLLPTALHWILLIMVTHTGLGGRELRDSEDTLHLVRLDHTHGFEARHLSSAIRRSTLFC